VTWTGGAPSSIPRVERGGQEHLGPSIISVQLMIGGLSAPLFTVRKWCVEHCCT